MLAAMHITATPFAPATRDTAPPTPLRPFLFAWAIFWVLLLTISVQENLHSRHGAFWQPLLWEGTSCLVASAVVWLLWRKLPRQDVHLTKPWRWCVLPLALLLPTALTFVSLVYALRHALYAMFGSVYQHGPWLQVYLYEAIKFGMFYLLFVAVFFGIRSYTAFSASHLREADLRIAARDAQLTQLAQQIEPHFLFNALNTIAATIHTDVALADSLVTRLSALLRTATDVARAPVVTLEEELRLLDHYAAIMRVRFADRVVVTMEVAADSVACRVPVLILQPLLENAFRHGVERHSGAAAITVRSMRAQGRLILEVEDNLGTLNPAWQVGVGIGNLRQRLTLTHGEAASFELRARVGGGVSARVELPCDC